jgi:hypothetical protein
MAKPRRLAADHGTGASQPPGIAQDRAGRSLVLLILGWPGLAARVLDTGWLPGVSPGALTVRNEGQQRSPHRGTGMADGWRALKFGDRCLCTLTAVA